MIRHLDMVRRMTAYKTELSQTSKCTFIYLYIYLCTHIPKLLIARVFSVCLLNKQ